MHNGSHSQKENRHVSHARITERDREKEGRRTIGYLFGKFYSQVTQLFCQKSEFLNSCFRGTQINRQSSTASLPALEKTWYGDTQSSTQTIPTTQLAVPTPIATSLGHSSSGSSVIAAAASQVVAATQQVNIIDG